MKWKLLLLTIIVLVSHISARPSTDDEKVTTTFAVEPSTVTTTVKPSTSSIFRPKKTTTTTVAATTEAPTEAPTTAIPSTTVASSNRSENVYENRELKITSDLDVGTNNQITLKEMQRRHGVGVAVPMTLEEYEKELEFISKSKKKTSTVSEESSTLKDGISTWILLSGSNIPTTKPEVKVSYRVENEDNKKRNNSRIEIINSPKKRPTTVVNKTTTTATTTVMTPPPTKTTKSSVKYKNNMLTKVKVSVLNEAKNNATSGETTVKPTTTKVTTPRTTKKRFTTLKTAKRTSKLPTTTTTSTTTTTTTEAPREDTEEVTTVTPETTTFLILEPKDADFNLPHDRNPGPSKKVKPSGDAIKKKKKKRPSEKIDTKKPADTKVALKKPEKPLTTQIYNYLAREVMPTVGVGLVGLVVTAGLASYFLGSPLTALRRNYEISNRKDDIPYDRIDEYSPGNTMPEEEMFGKVISGMPENSLYRNNIRIQTYRPRPQQNPGYPQQVHPQYANGNNRLRYAPQAPPNVPYQSQSGPGERYRRVGYGEPGYNPYPQYSAANYRPQPSGQPASSQPQQPPQPKSNEYLQQQMRLQQQMYQERIQKEQELLRQQQLQQQQQYRQHEQVEAEAEQELHSSQPQVDIETIELTTSGTQTEAPFSEYVNDPESHENYYIVQAESVPQSEPDQPTQRDGSRIPANHKSEDEPVAAASVFNEPEDDYQNSIANNILSKRRQFVVGSVLPEIVNELPQAAALVQGVPEHGPRRRRDTSRLTKKSKGLEDNEVFDVEEIDGTFKRETTTVVAELADISSENKEETTPPPSVETTTLVYDMNQRDGLVGFIRRLIELKLKMGISFLKMATTSFQEYLRGVEERVQKSSLFNPYLNTSTSTEKPSENMANNKPIKKRHN